MDKTLESSKLFPIIAWVLVIGFAIFTYTLTVSVQAEIDYIVEESSDTNITGQDISYTRALY